MGCGLCKGWSIVEVVKLQRYGVKNFISDFEYAMPPSCKNAKNVASTHKAIQIDPEALSKAKKKHFKAPKTTQAYAYTINTTRKWLDQVVLEATENNNSTISTTTTPTLFLHPLASLSFKKPTEVTAQILAQYITYQVITEKMSKSTGDTTQAAFKAFFNDWYAIIHLVGLSIHGILSSGFRGPWKPNPDPELCEGNPCESPDVRDTMTIITNYTRSTNPTRSHSHAIWISDIEKMFSLTASSCPPPLIQKANSNQVLEREELKAIITHLMWSAFASLAFALWTR